MNIVDPIVKLFSEEIGQVLTGLNIWSIIIRLFLTILISGSIGLERSSRRQAAGLRTYLLVCIGASAVTMANQFISNMGANTDAARLGLGVVQGVGFLGAGTIIVTSRNQIKGLTTAAGLLAVTCIGLIVGAGFYVPAIIATFVVYCVLSYSHILSTNLEHFYFIDLKISSNTPKEILEDIRKIFNKEKLEIMKMKIIDDDGEEFIKTEVKYKEKIDVNGIVAKIMAIDSVKEVVEVKSAE